MAANAIKTQSILFPNNNEAVAAFSSPRDKAEDIVAALGIKPYKAVVLILGGADDIDEEVIPRLTQLFGRGIARAAAESDAIIVDGGTKAGVMAMMGEGVAGRGHSSMLIGVAPVGKVTYPGSSASGTELEPNHSHFILVEGNEWGAETGTIFNLIGLLTGTPKRPARLKSKPDAAESEKAAAKIPALAILAGGGEISRDEVLRAVRHALPIIVVEGSGGLADEIAAAAKQKATLPNDPVMAEIIADGEIHLHPLTNSVNGIGRLIIRELGIDEVLMQAWEVFAVYDLNATLQQKRFSSIQFAILAVGVLGTALAIIQQVFAPKDAEGNPLAVSLAAGADSKGGPGWWLVHQGLIIIPILLTVLVTAATRFKQGSKWLLLRAGAEAIKREIYRYRARAKNYQVKPEHELSQRVEDITRRTMRTDVNLSALMPYSRDKGFPPYMDSAKGGDDGFSYLTPDRYVEVRLGDQLNYFQRKSVKLEKQLKILYWSTFIIGGIGTYLAAVNQQVWIALTTAAVAAIGTYLGYMQTENTLTKYNQAATDLANVKSWWNALSAEEQSLQENIDSLVDHTEQVLQSELDGWVQQMQNALAELRKAPPSTPEHEENKVPGESAPEAKPKASGDTAGAEDAATGAEPSEDPKPGEQNEEEEQTTGEGSPDASNADVIPNQPVDNPDEGGEPEEEPGAAGGGSEVAGAAGGGSEEEAGAAGGDTDSESTPPPIKKDGE